MKQASRNMKRGGQRIIMAVYLNKFKTKVYVDRLSAKNCDQYRLLGYYIRKICTSQHR